MAGKIDRNASGKGLRQKVRYLFRRYYQGIDIHPSARIAADVYLDRTNRRGIHIGADCVIDEGVVVLSHDDTRGILAETRIGAGTWIGPRAVIMPGVTVGTDCRVMPGAVVLADVADGVTVTGNPAKPERTPT